MFLLLFLLWLIAPLVELGVIIALCIRIEEYKKEKIEQKEEFERFGYISKYTMQEE